MVPETIKMSKILREICISKRLPKPQKTNAGKNMAMKILNFKDK